MSAFLKYSQTRRQKVKQDNPDMSNTDVSRLLGEMWRNASPKERAPYIEQEERERAVYKEDIKKWRDDQARMDAASRTSHQSVQKLVDCNPKFEFDRNYSSRSGSFENLHVDSFEEPSKRRAHRPNYGYGSYSQTSYQYPTASGKNHQICSNDLIWNDLSLFFAYGSTNSRIPRCRPLTRRGKTSPAPSKDGGRKSWRPLRKWKE